MPSKHNQEITFSCRDVRYHENDIEVTPNDPVPGSSTIPAWNEPGTDQEKQKIQKNYKKENPKKIIKTQNTKLNEAPPEEENLEESEDEDSDSETELEPGTEKLTTKQMLMQVMLDMKSVKKKIKRIDEVRMPKLTKKIQNIATKQIAQDARLETLEEQGKSNEDKIEKIVTNLVHLNETEKQNNHEEKSKEKRLGAVEEEMETKMDKDSEEIKTINKNLKKVMNNINKINDDKNTTNKETVVK